MLMTLIVLIITQRYVTNSRLGSGKTVNTWNVTCNENTTLYGLGPEIPIIHLIMMLDIGGLLTGVRNSWIVFVRPGIATSGLSRRFDREWNVEVSTKPPISGSNQDSRSGITGNSLNSNSKT
jgi:hypothetical protein